jgi:hypothetical protein
LPGSAGQIVAVNVDPRGVRSGEDLGRRHHAGRDALAERTVGRRRRRRTAAGRTTAPLAVRDDRGGRSC